MGRWKTFNMSWLKSGMWVSLRNGRQGVVVRRDSRLGYDNILMQPSPSGERVSLRIGGSYNWNTIGQHNVDCMFDIMYVFKPSTFNIDEVATNSPLMWERDKTRSHTVCCDGDAHLNVPDALFELIHAAVAEAQD